ncbi:MAG TPA: hypothetical protein PL195_07145, partial [bacterium]|nr:hypothetical protein [bacterium]
VGRTTSVLTISQKMYLHFRVGDEIAIPSPIKLPDKDKEKYSVLFLKFFIFSSPETGNIMSTIDNKTIMICLFFAMFFIF